MKKILIIEDEAEVRGVVVEALTQRGWNPLEAANGCDGIAFAARDLPDLILCDIQMPDKDGFEVLKEVRAAPLTATTPFVFLTGMSDKPRVRQAMELGADDYLVKPFTIKELIAAVEARFQKQDLLAKSSDQKLDELRGSLTFALPHELVTPLNSILGFSELIAGLGGSAEINEYAGLIRAAGERLKGLIEKFLLYAQLELSAADPRRREAAAARPPNETADTIIAAAERAAHASRRSGDLRLEASPVAHRIEASHLARLVQELLENAFKFSDPGSPVTLSSRPENGALILEVTDHGPGLSTEQIRKIGAHLQFDRKLREQQGSGLGLAICRRISELNGGSLNLSSVPGTQTRVTVSLPA